MTSDALPCQRVSLRSSCSSTVAKYFEPPCIGRPKGLSNPADTSTGMSCIVNPSSQAVHRAYAKRALMRIPSLEEYEQAAAEKAKSAVSAH